MSRNISRITLTLVACLLGAAYSHGQNFAQAVPPPAQAAGGVISRGGGNVFYTPAFPSPHDHDPETAKLNQEEHQLAQQADQLARRLGDAENTGDRDKLRTELREVLGKQFDIQRQRREQEIAQIEERVRKLRDQLKKRSDNRQKIIDNRIEQILNDTDGLGWNGPDGGGPHAGFMSGIFGGGGGRAVTLPAPVPGPGARGIAPAPPGIPGAPRSGRAPGKSAPDAPSAQPGAAPAER